MAKGRFNWSLAIVLALALAVLAGSALLLRNFRRSSRAEKGLTLGIAAYDRGDWSEAASQLGRYLGVIPDDADVLMKYAQANLKVRPVKRGSVQQALAAYRNILRLDKSNLEASRQLVELYLGMNVPAEAEFVAREALKGQDDAELSLMLASSLISQRKFTEAAEALRELTEDHPDQIGAYTLMARLAQERPEEFPHDSPQNWLDLAVSRNSQTAEAYVGRARFHLASGRREEALADMGLARTLGSENSRVLLALANLNLQAGDAEHAREYLAEIEARDPATLGLWQARAELARRSDVSEQMNAVARAGIEALGYNRWDFLPTAIELFLRAGELESADKYIAEMKAAELGFGRLAFFEGQLAQSRGEIRQAAGNYRRAIEQGYDVLASRAALADMLVQLGDLRSATQQLRTLVAHQPDNPENHLALARMLLRTGNAAEAEQQAGRARQLAPQRTDAVFLYVQSRLQNLEGTDAPAEETSELEALIGDLLALDSESVSARLLRVHLYTLASRLDEAQTIISDLKKQAPADLQVGLAEVALLQKRGDEAQIMPLLRRLVEEHPSAIVPIQLLAIHLRDDDPAGAEQVLRGALERIANLGSQRELAFLLASFHDDRQEPEKAQDVLMTFARDWPEEIPVRQALLRREAVLADEAKAQQILTEIKDIEGEQGQTWPREQARLWLNSGNFKTYYSQLTGLLKETLRLDPDDQESRLLLAAAHQKAGEMELAITTYRQAYERAPRSLAAIVPLVAALNQAGNYEEADEIARQAATYNLEHPTLSQLELQGRLARGQLDAGVALLEDMLSESPGDAQTQLLLAALKIENGDLAEARILLDQVQLNHANSLAVSRVRIQLYLAENRPDDAMDLCNRLVEQDKSVEAYLLRAATSLALRNVATARQDADELMARDDLESDALVRISELYRRLGQTAPAVAAARKAMEREPQDLQIRQNALRTLLAAPDEESRRQGAAFLDDSLQLYPESPELKVLKAEELLSRPTAPGMEMARNLLQQVTRENTRIARAWLVLGEMELANGDAGRAAELALRGLASSPDSKELMLLKARAEAVYSPPLAVATLRACRENNPNDLDVLLRLVDAYFAAGQAQDAARLLTSEMERRNESERGRLRVPLAAALYRTGQTEQAMQMLDEAISSDRESPAPILTQAMLLRDEQQWEELERRVMAWCKNSPDRLRVVASIGTSLIRTEQPAGRQLAERLLRYAMGENQENVAAAIGLAELLQYDQRFEEAARVYEALIKGYPTHVIAMNNLAWLYCEYLERAEQALALTDRGLEIAPDYLDMLDTRAVIHFRLGQYEPASRDLEKCLELYPPQAPGRACAWFHLGRVQLQQDLPRLAAESFAQAIEANRQHGGLTADDLTEIERLQSQLP